MNLLTIKEAAAAIRMSQGWIKKAIREKELPVAKFGRAVRIRPEDLQRYVSTKIEGGIESRDGSLTAKVSNGYFEKTIGYRP